MNWSRSYYSETYCIYIFFSKWVLKFRESSADESKVEINPFRDKMTALPFITTKDKKITNHQDCLYISGDIPTSRVVL